MKSAVTGAWAMAERHAHAVLLALIVLLGILARAPGFGCNLGSDDVLSVESFLRWGPQRFLLGPYYSNNHPFAALCSWATCLVFGDHDWAIKLPAFLFGIASIPLIYVLGRRVYRNPWCGLTAALLLATIPAHVGYSTAFRGFSAAMFFAIASALLLYENLRRPSGLTFVGLTLSILLMGLSHLFFLLLLGSWGAIVLGYGAGRVAIRDYRSRKTLVAFLSTSFALGIGTLLVAAAYWPALDLIGETWHRLIRGSWSATMIRWLSGSEGAPGAFPFDMMTEVATGFTGRSFWFGSALAAVGLVGAMLKRCHGAAICMAGLLLPLVISYAGGLNPGPRYLLEILPFFVLTLGAGVVYVSDAAGASIRWILPFRMHRIALCGLMAVVLWGFVPTYSRNFPHGPETMVCNPSDYRSALRRAVAEMDPNDVVDCRWFFLPVDYYMGQMGGETPLADVIPSHEYRLWILMYSDTPDFEGFPLRSEPERVASFRGCTLWVGQPRSNPLREVPLAQLADLGQSAETLRRWRECGPVANGMHVEADSGTVRVHASDTVRVNWGLTQDHVPVGERKRVIFRAQVQDGSGNRLTRLWFRYFGADGSMLREEPRYARRITGDGPWGRIQLGVLTPKGTAFIQPEIHVEGVLRAGEELRFRDVRMWVEEEDPQPQAGQYSTPS